MPVLMKEWEIYNSFYYKSYDDCMPGLLNRCDLKYSSNNESDKCDNLNKNQAISDEGLYYTEYLSEEDNYGEILITDDEISDLIVGYKSDGSSTEKKGK